MLKNDQLRQRAEARFLENALLPSASLEAMSPEATRQILHELGVHQIELEMQNEELRQSQVALDASRARYFDLYDLAPVGYCTLNEPGLILQVNLTAATLLGATRDALNNNLLSKFILKEDQDIFYYYRKQLFESGKPQSCELRMVKHDGTPFWAHLEATAAQVADDATLVAHVILTDITERRHAARLLAEAQVVAESEEKFRKITESTQDAIIMMGADQCISFWNAAAERLFGYSAAEAMGQELHALIVPAAAHAKFTQAFPHFQKTGEGLLIGKVTEVKALRKGGEEFPIELSISATQLNGQWHAISVIRDITERKQIEVKLRESEEKFRAIFKEAKDGIILTDAETGLIADCNAEFERQCGRPLAQLKTLHPWDLRPPELQEAAHSKFGEVKATGHGHIESGFQRPDGTFMPAEVVATRVRLGDRDYLISISRDITERKRADELLNKTQQLLKETEQIGKVGGWEFDIDTQKQIWTEGVYRIHEVDYDYDPNVAKGINFYTPESRPIIEQAVWRAVEKGEPFDMELEITSAKGNLRSVHTMGKRDLEHRRVYGFFQDITERKQAEAQLNEQLNELRRWYDATLGQGMRNIELKREINELLKQAGQPPRYLSAEPEEGSPPIV